MSLYSNLVCCGGQPYVCQNYTNVSTCPSGYDPQFCCNSDGSLSSASISVDQYGNPITVCPNYGTVPYNTYDASVCQQYPVYSCCNNNYCYQSKDPNCNYYGTADAPTIGGMVVSDCSQCGPTVSCCWPGQICQINDAATGCPDPASSVVSDCSKCPTGGF